MRNKSTERSARPNKHTDRPEARSEARGDGRSARPNKHAERPDSRGDGRSEGRGDKTYGQIAVKSQPEGMLNDLLEAHPLGMYLILDCIQDPHNLGAILRTADGAGVVAVIAPKDKSVGITETVLRVSVGAAQNIPFIQVTNLSRTMKQLKDAGIWITGTSDKGEKSVYEMDFKGGIALVMGAEGDGMRRLTEENCDFLINIPMKGSVPCLNVSVATGVCLYEALRQRQS